MTREEAATWIKERVMWGEYNKGEYKEALDMAIKALEQEPCEDAISRQAVIDAIDKWVKAEHILETLPTDKVTPLFKSVHKLPFVTPTVKTGKWIPAHDSQYIYVLKCSCCNWENRWGIDDDGNGTYYYCPNCGAKMIEPQTEKE